MNYLSICKLCDEDFKSVDYTKIFRLVPLNKYRLEDLSLCDSCIRFTETNLQVASKL